MAGTFKFELVTPERMVLSQDASQVVVPGVEGEFTVLPGHAPVISALRPGVVDATLGDARNIRCVREGRLCRGRCRSRDGIGGARTERRSDGCGHHQPRAAGGRIRPCRRLGRCRQARCRFSRRTIEGAAALTAHRCCVGARTPPTPARYPNNVTNQGRAAAGWALTGSLGRLPDSDGPDAGRKGANVATTSS